MAEVVGFAASVLQITSNCVKTVHTLDTLRHRYKNAPDAIDSLYSESSAIHGSLLQLSHLIDQRDNSLVQALRAKPELSRALHAALSGCQTVFSLLQQKLDDIVPKSGPGGNLLGLKRRASFLWHQDLLKGYLTQIQGHQVALSLLLQGLQMHSLSDLNRLLQETKLILTKMADDQITLQGSPSTPHIYPSDNDTELKDQVMELKTDLKGVDIAYPKGKQISRSLQDDVNLINLEDEPSLLDSHIEESVSPTFGDLRLLDARRGSDQLYLSSRTASSNSSIMEKRDSAQSATFKSPSQLRRASETSAHSSHSNHSRRVSDALSPLGWDPNASTLDRSGSSGSTHVARSMRAASIQSEFPEVVIDPRISNPFPKVVEPPPYLPLLPEEQQRDLLRRRYTIVTADDQLLWAEEALHFVSITARHRERISRTQTKTADAEPEEMELERQAKQLVRLHLPSGNCKALFLQASYFGLDPETNMELFRASLGNGYHRSAFYIGNMLEANSRIKRNIVLGYYKEGAVANDAACNYRLAEASLNGELGLKKEHKDAIWYLRRAAEMPDRDFPQALFLLGLLQTESYRHTVKIKDSLLPVDEAAARELFKQGAQLGCSNCQIHLGHAFRLARYGCPKDPATALHYFQLAARQGVPDADFQISNYFGWGEPGFVEVHPQLSYVYARRAAEDGWTPALAQVGYFYEKGLGVTLNKEKAKEWYLKAIARGDKMAEKRLDAMRNRSVFGSAR